MPMASVLLRPGVNTQATPSLNEAGVSESQLIRYRDSLIEKLGGWVPYYPLTISSTIRDIHAWQGLASNKYLSVGATASLSVINSDNLSDITPQTRESQFAPDFSVSSGSNVITVVDAGSSVTTFDTVFFNTPVAVGTTFLSGAYPVNTTGGSSTYTILSSSPSDTTVASSGILPIFTVTEDSALVEVELPNNNYLSIPGLYYGFYAATTVGGVTIEGLYSVRTVVDSTSFTIIAPTQASTNAVATMNSSLVEVVYYISEGPPSATGGGYGVGGYGLGGYGIGSTGGTGGEGDPITAEDWTMDNWGSILLACPVDGPIYQWDPDSGFSTASVIATGPFFNGGIFISMPQQILVAWKSCSSVSGSQNPLLVRWSDAGDFTTWDSTPSNAAGSFTFPTGSLIVGGLQASNYGMIWTDIDAWIMQYVGGDVIFNFTKVGSGCGLIGRHACAILGGNIYWCGTNNFFTIRNGGVEPMPCTVWDFIFQNLNTAYKDRIQLAPNSSFNEFSCFFPSMDSTGENDAYVKFNVRENQWDYGYLNRTAWHDVSPLGQPIGTTNTSIFQHEEGYNAGNVPMVSSFTTGYWSISEGNEMAFVDWILPDMKFGTYSGAKTAECEITFQSLDYTGDTPRTYGPYSFTEATDYINVRIRGRFMSMTVTTNDSESFWRIGRIRYRWAPAGRR